MIIHVYAQVWNETVLMPYFLRHYSSFCDKIIVYDDGSDDGTRELVQACPIAELRNSLSFGVDDTAWVEFWSSVYKESRGVADWVILVDGDEFVYHKNIKEILQYYTCAGITLPYVQGYNMVSEAPPTTNKQIYDEIYIGYVHPRETKRCIINPNLDLTYEVGRHTIHVKEAHISDAPDITLLHYNLLGIDYVQNRYHSYKDRMSLSNISHNWGSYVFESYNDTQKRYLLGLSQAKPLTTVLPEAQNANT